MPEGDEIYRSWLDDVWGGNARAAHRVVSADFVGHWPSGEVRGVEELVAVVSQTHAMFDGITFALEVGPVREGDLLAARWRGEGRRGSSVTRFYGHDLLRVVGGQVVEYWPATVTLPEH